MPRQFSVVRLNVAAP